MILRYSSVISQNDQRGGPRRMLTFQPTNLLYILRMRRAGKIGRNLMRTPTQLAAAGAFRPGFGCDMMMWSLAKMLLAAR